MVACQSIAHPHTQCVLRLGLNRCICVLVYHLITIIWQDRCAEYLLERGTQIAWLTCFWEGTLEFSSYRLWDVPYDVQMTLR